MILYDKISAQLPAWRERMKSLVKDHGDVIKVKKVEGLVPDEE